MADLLGSILKSAEKPPTVGDKETRRRDREQAARRKKMQQDEKKKKAEFRKRMEKEVSEFIQDSKQQKRKYNSTGKIERSILHDVAEVAEFILCIWQEFAPSDDELEAYQKGMEWDPQKADYRPALEEETAKKTQKRAVSPSSNYRDKYSHLIGTSAAKDAAHSLILSWTLPGFCVKIPVANKRDTRSIEQAMNEIRGHNDRFVTLSARGFNPATSCLCYNFIVGVIFMPKCLI
uniref:Sperm associated antigen 7 n=1 Tax=Salmo trutta TaxID=8032 RepID=A0A674BMZ5_SALTR